MLGTKKPDFLSSLNEKLIKGENKIGNPLNSRLAFLASTLCDLSFISNSEALINQSSWSISHVVRDAFFSLFLFSPSKKSNDAYPLRVLLNLVWRSFNTELKVAFANDPVVLSRESSSSDPCITDFSVFNSTLPAA